jgi:hypothetical protein
MKTLEERIKFNHGLTIGQHLVNFTLGDKSRLALVEIRSSGQVWYFTKPREGDMYTSWTRIRGDNSSSGNGAIKLWAEKDAELMAKFDGEPAATIEVRAS